ncbi:MAG: lipase family protein [Verrucomicrobiota bacterium]
MLVMAVAALSVQAQPASSLRITNFQGTGEGWVLGWEQSATGTAYTVQFQDTLQDGIWRSPASAAPFPVAGKEWLDAWSTNASRFYRVIGVPAAQRGQVLSATLNNGLTALQLAFLFNLAGVPITPQYDVGLYKIVYETITPLGARTLASGALVLPQNAGGALPLVSYQHGTLTQTNSAPSSLNLSGEVTIGIAFATTGYAAAVPDYLGLGDSPGLHPYHHARSEATAGVDMLRAVKAFCATNGFALNDRLFLCGYSEGGHATMALLRELETFHTNEFTVTACAPMAGAYDLSGVTTEDFLTNRFAPNPYYFVYLLAAYQDVYHLAPSLASLLRVPYDTALPPLLGGNASGSQINAAMPADPTQILKPDYLAAFRAQPRHPLRLALEENDLYRWKPRAPLRLYHCSGDLDVDPANSQVALASFHALGATQVELIDPQPGADHSGCAQPSLLQAKAWFDSLK